MGNTSSCHARGSGERACHRDHSISGGSIGAAIHYDLPEFISTASLNFGLSPENMPLIRLDPGQESGWRMQGIWRLESRDFKRDAKWAESDVGRFRNSDFEALGGLAFVHCLPEPSWLAPTAGSVLAGIVRVPIFRRQRGLAGTSPLAQDFADGQAMLS